VGMPGDIDLAETNTLGLSLARDLVENQLMGKLELRARPKITWHFRIPSSGHLRPILNRKVLEIGPLFLRLCDLGSNKSDLNLGANSTKLFLGEP
jgi:hypothetical protein